MKERMMRQLREEEIKRLHLMAANKGKERLNVAIYARKSREDKTETSLSTQVSECKAFIERYQSLLYLDENHIYSEDNVSGMYVENRKELLTLLDKVADGQVDVVVVLKSDRFSRSSKMMIELINDLEKNKAYLVAGDDLGDNSAAGILMKQIFWATNEFYVRKNVEDVMLVHSKLAESGYTVGGPGNYGYDVYKRKYVINPQEALAVNLVFDMFLEGKSYTDIANALDYQGFKPRFSERFSHSTIHSILTNKRNCGISVWNDPDKRRDRQRISKQVFEPVESEEVVPEAIISKEKFYRVQDLLEDRTIAKGNNKYSSYLLTGLAVCGECGGAITGNSQRAGRNKTLYRTYYCKNHKKKHGGTCKTKPIRVEYLEDFIKSQIVHVVNNHLKVDGFDEKTIKSYFKNDQDTLKRLKRELTDHENLLSKMTQGLYKATSDAVKASTEREIEKITPLIEVASSQIEHLTNKEAIFDKQKQQMIDNSIGFDDLFFNDELSKRLFRLLIKQVTVTNQDISIEFN